MPVLSARSRKELATCHPDLRRLMEAVAEESGEMFEVICGHRGKADQNRAYAEGRSKLPFPQSRHNSQPSEAVDIVPLPIDWSDIAAFKRLAGVVKATAMKLGIEVEHGGDWRMRDWPHWQLEKQEPG